MYPNELIPLLVLAAGIVGATVGFFVVRKIKKERKKREEEFINLLLNAFSNEAISGVEDVLSFYHAHFVTDRSKIEVYRKIYCFIEIALLRISSASSPPLNKLKDRLQELRELMKRTAVILEAEEKRVPFYGTPASERELLEDILELTNSDKAIVNAKLARLAELIRVRQETINTLGEEKGKARRLSFWGLAGTIFFGILSVALTIWTLARGGH